MTKQKKINVLEILENEKNKVNDNFFDEYGLPIYDFEEKDNKEKIVYTDLKKYKKAIDKYCFTISFGCMFKIGMLLLFSTLLTIFKVWLYITYC